MAGRYLNNAKEDAVQFQHDIQKMMIEETLNAAKFQRFTVDGIATDPSHLHVLNHWHDEREFHRIGMVCDRLSRDD